jgi:hypothetical protein
VLVSRQLVTRSKLHVARELDWLVWDSEGCSGRGQAGRRPAPWVARGGTAPACRQQRKGCLLCSTTTSRTKRRALFGRGGDAQTRNRSYGRVCRHAWPSSLDALMFVACTIARTSELIRSIRDQVRCVHVGYLLDRLIPVRTVRAVDVGPSSIIIRSARRSVFRRR